MPWSDMDVRKRSFDLEDFLLSEVSETKTNTVWYHSYVESKEKLTKQSKIGSYQGIRVGGIGQMLFKGTDLQWVVNKS